MHYETCLCGQHIVLVVRSFTTARGRELTCAFMAHLRGLVHFQEPPVQLRDSPHWRCSVGCRYGSDKPNNEKCNIRNCFANKKHKSMWLLNLLARFPRRVREVLGRIPDTTEIVAVRSGVLVTTAKCSQRFSAG